MISVTFLSKGKLSTCDIHELKNPDTPVIIDCLKPTREELMAVSEKAKIPFEEFDRALDEKERPSISDFENYSVICFASPREVRKHHYLTSPFTIFIKSNMFIVVRTEEIDALNRIKMYDDHRQVEILNKDITYILYIYLSEVMDHFFRAIDELEFEVEMVEENVFKVKKQALIKEIFSLKKTLIFFHKALTGNREVIIGIERQFLRQIRGRNLRQFQYLYFDVFQLIDTVDTYRDILTSTLDIYLTSVSNDMTDVMKRLTVITSLVLVPTLISGIYGMNFQYMPEIHKLGPYGYPFALGLMAISLVVVFGYFKKMKWW